MNLYQGFWLNVNKAEKSQTPSNLWKYRDNYFRQKSKNPITCLADMLVFTAYSSKYVHGICVMQLITKLA